MKCMKCWAPSGNNDFCDAHNPDKKSAPAPAAPQPVPAAPAVTPAAEPAKEPPKA